MLSLAYHYKHKPEIWKPNLSKKKNGGIVPLHYGWQPRMSLDLDHFTAIIIKPALFIHFPLVFVLTTQFR